MSRLHLRRSQILQFCLFTLSISISSEALRLKSEKHAARDVLKHHKTLSDRHVSHHKNDPLATRRSTYRIKLPVKVAKLLFPQMTNRNAETVIRIYPDRSTQVQNKTGEKLVLSVNYNTFNDDGSRIAIKPKRRACYYGVCPGCCPGCCSVCCPGCMCKPAPTVPMPGLCICHPRPICPQPCCISCAAPAPPPPPPPPPKPPPAPPCPMVCLPICPPCPKPCHRPCMPRPCIPRPCIPRPCRIPAPPITGPAANGPCVPAPPIVGPCHSPCMPSDQDIPYTPVHYASPEVNRRPIVVDHPLKGPPIYIDQCRDTFQECKAFAKRGMCNHPSPFHSIQQIRRLCSFSCGICNDYDENVLLLRRQSSLRVKVPPAVRLAKLKSAFQQIMPHKAFMGDSTTAATQHNKQKLQTSQSGEKKSRTTNTSHPQQYSHEPTPIKEERGSGNLRDGLQEETV